MGFDFVIFYYFLLFLFFIFFFYFLTFPPSLSFSCWINGTSFSGQLSFFIPLFLTFLLGIASLFTSLYRTKNVFGDSKVRQDVLLRQTVYVGAFMVFVLLGKD